MCLGDYQWKVLTLRNQQERRYVEASARILVALDHLTTRSMFRKRTNGEARVRR